MRTRLGGLAAIAAIAAIVLGAACTTAAGSGSGGVTTPTPAASVTPSSGDPSGGTDVFVRTCDSRVYGDLGSGWRASAVTAGPLAFVGARGYADATDRELGRGDRRFVLKLLVVVAGAEPVTLTIFPTLRSRAALVYDPALFNRGNRGLERATGSITFEPCGGDQPATQFNGGIVVRERLCLPLRVAWGSREDRVFLPLGSRDCPAGPS